MSKKTEVKGHIRRGQRVNPFRRASTFIGNKIKEDKAKQEAFAKLPLKDQLKTNLKREIPIGAVASGAVGGYFGGVIGGRKGALIGAGLGAGAGAVQSAAWTTLGTVVGHKANKLIERSKRKRKELKS